MGTYYRVQQGDCLSSIAAACGFPDYETVYFDPGNADFRKQRPNPNVIFLGDLLFIPDRKSKQCERSTEQRHRFVVKRPKVFLRLCLKDDMHQPYANARYQLRVGSEYFESETDGEGLLEQRIPANVRDGEITVFTHADDPADEGYTFILDLGYLDPTDEISGVDARLINLGFGSLETQQSTGMSESDRAAALRNFQQAFGLPVTGEADRATREKLRQLHDAD